MEKDWEKEVAKWENGIKPTCYAVRYLVLTSTSNWARYVDRIRSQVRTGVD